MTGSPKPVRLDIQVDRAPAAPPLVEQIVATLRLALVEGRVEAGARLPSWRDLAAQLGVGRGTVQAAYERLSDEGLILSAGAAGTRAADVRDEPPPTLEVQRPLQNLLRGFSTPCLAFQTGVPAQDAFPAGLWARCLNRAVRQDALQRHQLSRSARASGAEGADRRPPGHRARRPLRARPGDRHGQLPRGAGPGDPGRRGGRTRGLDGGPGLSPTRMSLADAGTSPCRSRSTPRAWTSSAGWPWLRRGRRRGDARPARADRRGAVAERRCGAAGLGRAQAGAWIIEDDYLSELQLDRPRGAGALASEPGGERVIHIGSFSKTLKLRRWAWASSWRLRGPGRTVRTAGRHPGPDLQPTSLQPAMTDDAGRGALYEAPASYEAPLRPAPGRALQGARRARMEPSRPMAGPPGAAAACRPGRTMLVMAQAGPALGVAPTALSPWYADRGPGARRAFCSA